MKLVTLPVGAVGFDILQPLTPTILAALNDFKIPDTQTGFAFYARYLENTTPQELAAILDTGRGVVLVGESRANGWIPSAGAGSADGMREVSRARTLLVPDGTQLWCDLEEPSQYSTPAMLSDYAGAQCDIINRSHFVPSAYIGSGLNASSSELYQLPYKGYWHSLSEVQNVAVVGTMMLQLFPTVTLPLSTGPLGVDINIVQQDKHGRLPTMIVKS